MIAQSVMNTLLNVTTVAAK